MGESARPTGKRAVLERYRFFREIVIVGLGYLVYSQVRGLAADRSFDALANAYRVIDFEESLGIFKELAVQAYVLPNSLLVQAFNLIYFYGFFPLLLPTAIWLFVKYPRYYALLRNAFLVSGGIAVLFFVMLPTAPPRLTPDMGFVDTLSRSFTPTYESIPGVNHFAALPSMHVGWTLLTTIGIYIGMGKARWRFVVWLLPIMMMTSTVATGNHYFIDGLLGMAVAVIGLGIAVVIENPGAAWRSIRRAGPRAETSA